MTFEVDGKTIETTEAGFLANIEDWSEALAELIASDEGLTLTRVHWDVVNYLREEFINNAGNQPNNRNMLKEIGKIWGRKIASRDLYDLFPGNPSKQAGRIGGLPESRRKGGY